MRLYRIYVSEVDLFNSGKEGVIVEWLHGSVLVAITQDIRGWAITYYRL